MPQDPSPLSALDSDVDLLREIAKGSSEALAGFYDRHAAVALGLLCRLLGQRTEAEEILQEVFLQVWRDARRYDPGHASPRGWLLWLARSRALDHYRGTAALGMKKLRETLRRREMLGPEANPHGQSTDTSRTLTDADPIRACP